MLRSCRAVSICLLVPSPLELFLSVLTSPPVLAEGGGSPLGRGRIYSTSTCNGGRHVTECSVRCVIGGSVLLDKFWPLLPPAFTCLHTSLPVSCRFCRAGQFSLSESLRMLGRSHTQPGVFLPASLKAVQLVK